MKTVTIELRDIDYKDIEKSAKQRGKTIADYIMGRYYLDIDENDRINAIENIIEQTLYDCKSIREIDKKAEHIRDFVSNIGYEAVRYLEEEEEE